MAVWFVSIVVGLCVHVTDRGGCKTATVIVSCAGHLPYTTLKKIEVLKKITLIK